MARKKKLRPFTSANSSEFDIDKLSGKLPVRLLNDYMFHVLFLKNNHLLKAFLASILHEDISNITSCQITNPIQYGRDINSKTVIYDMKITLNNQIYINLEIQVLDEKNWTERSMIYLCRTFDNLEKNVPYTDVKPSIHIGLLNYTLFHDHPEFCSVYSMMNVKNHNIYSRKFLLYVIDLTQIELATEEDKQYQVDLWARFFTAGTWEDIKMLAKRNPIFKEASEAICKLSRKERIRLEYEAREDYFHRRADRLKIERAQKAQLREMDSQISKQRAELMKKESQISEQQTELIEKESQISEQQAELIEKESQISEQQAELIEKESQISEQQAELIKKESQISEQQAELDRLKTLLVKHGIHSDT